MGSREPGRRAAISIIALAAVLAALAPLWQMRSDRQEMETRHAAARVQALQDVKAGAAELAARLQELEETLAAVADDVRAGRLASSEAEGGETLQARAARVFEDDAAIVGLGVAWTPPADDPDARPRVRLWPRGGPAHGRAITEEQLDLRTFQPETAWYYLARFDGPGWRPPHVPPGSPDPILVFTAPVCPGVECDLQSTEPAQVVTLAVSLQALEGTVRGLSLGAQSEALLVTSSGELVVHPRMELVRARGTLHQLAWTAGDPVLGEAAVDISQGLDGIHHRVDPATGKGEHLVWRQVADSSHALVVHVPDEVLGTPQEARSRLLALLGQGIVSLFLIGLLISAIVAPDGIRLAWGAAGSLSVTALLTIAAFWYAAASCPDPPNLAGEPIVAGSDLRAFEVNWASGSKARDMEPPRFVRTGIFVQSLEFENANNVTVTGMIWQHIDMAFVDPEAEPEPDFILPEADPGEELVIELAYQREREGAMLRGWRFRALLRQDFDYLDYPFDRQDIWIRILPKEFDRNVVLVPDLLAYDRTAPEAEPGVESELVLPGWDRDGAGFSYRNRAYDTDFGIEDYEGQGGFPELIYSVRISRAFLGPFVGKVIPLAVAASMLFCMLLLGTRDERYEGSFGFSAMEVVLGAAALFFVVIFDHSALREDLATTKPFYLEYFYFVMYLALVGVCVNAIVFAMGHVPWLQNRDNLLPKLAFWPMYLGSMAAVTAAIFW